MHLFDLQELMAYNGNFAISLVTEIRQLTTSTMNIPGFLDHVSGQRPQYSFHHCQVFFTIMSLGGKSNEST